MRACNVWTKLKENSTRSNGEIYILSSDNSEERVREDITCYMCILIIDRKTPIIYDLNKFFIPYIKFLNYYLKK